MRSSPVKLFTPLTLREVTLPNRIGVSPMCQYSCQDGEISSWHLVHLGSRAVGGAGLIIAEATAVSPEGRISLGDSGLWTDRQGELWKPVVEFLLQHGSIPGIQLAHAGRKAGVDLPWQGGRPLAQENGGWPVVGPSALAFSGAHQTPLALDRSSMQRLIEDFRKATLRADRAGFQVLELHMAHGYLLHEFLSPLSNHRQDDYGGELEGRLRFPLEVAEAVREVWPEGRPMLVRISATDWVEGGWDVEQSVILAQRLRTIGVDLIDCSSGGASPQQSICTGSGYQVPFAARLKEAGLPTAAVGEITDAAQAETILSTGQADLILLARASLREPYWPMKAAQQLGAKWSPPSQYERGYPNR